jgi:hypothetical protein
MPAREAPADLRPDTVEALLEIVWHLRDEERDRDQSFTVRGVGLAGFAGVILSLSNTVARPALQADLSGALDAVSLALFIVAALALVAALGFTLFGVLLPREAISLGSDEISRFISHEFVNAHKAMAQGREMRGLIRSLLRQRVRNDVKARWLRHAYVALSVGLLALALLGLTLAGMDAGALS